MGFLDVIEQDPSDPRGGRPCLTCKVINGIIGKLSEADRREMAVALDTPTIGIPVIARALRAMWADDNNRQPCDGSLRNCRVNHASRRVEVSA